MGRSAKKPTAPKTIDDIGVVDTFQSPESSNVEGAAYNTFTGELVVAYRDKKKEVAETAYWKYTKVSPEDWQAFKTAESKGKFKNEVILKKYGPGERM